MLLERAEMVVKAGAAEEFAASMAQRGVPLLRRVPGVNSVRFGRGVEQPDKFMLLVEWASMEAHVEFAKAPSMTEFRHMIGPYSGGGAMEHFDME